MWKAPAQEIIDTGEGTGFDANSQVREYTKNYLLVATDPRVGSLNACYGPGIPRPYSPYFAAGGLEFDLNALCVRISAKRMDKDDWQRWLVTVQYSTNVGRVTPQTPEQFGQPSRPQGSANNPELEPPVIDWDFEISKESPPMDLDGQLFVNSANDYYNPPPMIDMARPVLSIERNQINFSAIDASSYAFAVNNKPFLGQPVGTAQCYPPKARQMNRGGIQYWRVNYKIRFRTLIPIYKKNKFNKIIANPLAQKEEILFTSRVTGNTFTLTPGKTWQPQLLDQGLNEWNNASQTSVPIFKALQGKITKPVALDGHGGQSLVIQNPDNTTTLQTVWNQWRCYPYADFDRILNQGV